LVFDSDNRKATMKNLHNAIANALFWDLAVPRHRVTADVVEGGWVILKGVRSVGA